MPSKGLGTLSKMRDGIGNEVLYQVVANYSRGIQSTIRDMKKSGVTRGQMARVLGRYRRIEKIKKKLRENRWKHDKPAGL